MITGACLCGAVRYEVDGPVRGLAHCHCSMCRKHHGTPFASYVGARAEHFHWMCGNDSAVGYSSSGSYVRRFCATCSAKVPTPMDEMVSIPAGNLLGDLGDGRGTHAFVGSKAPWHVIADDLPQYEAAPPGWPPPQPSRQAPPFDATTHGSCLCGKVSFHVTGAPARWLQCHCSRCRRGRSAAHASNMFYPVAQFVWRTGRELVKQYRLPEAQRFAIAFCAECGGATPVERDSVPFVLVPAGLLDTDPGARPQAHIHVASKAPWYAIRDSIPQFPELPPTTA